MQTATMPAPKSVRTIPATIDIQSVIHQSHRRLRVAAYCRVSTKQEEQLNSYEVQKKYYEDRIRTEPKWSLVGIFADKGITGTSMKKRDEFNKMLRLCRKGKIDMIIVKSISRFARNTLDWMCTLRSRICTALSRHRNFTSPSMEAWHRANPKISVPM